MKTVDVLAAVLVVVGAVNWGLVGAANVDLVKLLLGTSVLANLVYVLVGLAGVFQAAQFKSIQRRWCGVAQPA